MVRVRPSQQVTNVRGSVVIQIDWYCVFHIRRFADHDGRPRLGGSGGSRMKIEPSDTALFPTGHNVGHPVPIEIRQFDAVRPAGRIVDRVTRPRFGGPSRGGNGEKTKGCSKRSHGTVHVIRRKCSIGVTGTRFDTAPGTRCPGRSRNRMPATKSRQIRPFLHVAADDQRASWQQPGDNVFPHMGYIIARVRLLGYLEPT